MASRPFAASLTIAFCFALCAALGACADPPIRHDLVGTTLPACAYEPRCKSSQAPTSDNWHHIAALHYSGESAQAQALLRAAIQAEPRTKIIVDRPGYLYATFRTRLMRFTDDVQLVFVDDGHTIHVRSSGRIGWYDWGTNRRRVERLRQALDAT